MFLFFFLLFSCMCANVMWGSERSGASPAFATEVNVDRSKPCSRSAVVALVTGYSLQFIWK